MASDNPVLVEVLRGGIVESRHRGAYAVIDGDGTLVDARGDIERAIFPRSSMKILQGIPLVESGAADAFACTPAELALACASHSGEDFHVKAVGDWLARVGLVEADLACAPHNPMSVPAYEALVRAGTPPCRLHNNCSGKHTGFLTLALHLGVATRGYQKRAHAVQQAAFEATAALTDQPVDMPYGIDGCAAPNPCLPLKALALAMSRIAVPDRLAPERGRAVARLAAAMAEYPELVAGTGRACTRLMRAALPGTVAKTGAEAVYIVIAPSKGLGIALKIDDGGTRAAETLVAGLMERHGLLDGEKRETVADLIAPVLTNWGGEPVGTVRLAEGA
ncbi:asparaginase [Zavarzinia sp.]|uniref:asparaginase n=1 Tax=Zavarzinia sp. TaxID=2027920 RepID=UPI003567D368